MAANDRRKPAFTHPAAKESKPSIKNQIRGVERLLKKADLPQHVVAQKQRYLAGLKAALEEQRRAELAKKYEAQYKKVKFFERVKLERQIKQAQRQLSGLDRNAEPEVAAALTGRLAQLRDDLNYVMHFPPHERYVSVLRTPDDPTARAAAEADRARLRILVRQRLAELALLAEGDEGAGIIAEQQQTSGAHNGEPSKDAVVGMDLEAGSDSEFDQADLGDVEQGGGGSVPQRNDGKASRQMVREAGESSKRASSVQLKRPGPVTPPSQKQGGVSLAVGQDVQAAQPPLPATLKVPRSKKGSGMELVDAVLGPMPAAPLPEPPPVFPTEEVGWAAEDDFFGGAAADEAPIEVHGNESRAAEVAAAGEQQQPSKLPKRKQRDESDVAQIPSRKHKNWPQIPRKPEAGPRKMPQFSRRKAAGHEASAAGARGGILDGRSRPKVWRGQLSRDSISTGKPSERRHSTGDRVGGPGVGGKQADGGQEGEAAGRTRAEGGRKRRRKAKE